MAKEDQINEPDKEIFYKTKVVTFQGRTTPIILQNDNGPCPLIAICNVLLLRNIINLSEDSCDVSLQHLLTLILERLLDSFRNVEHNKDEEYAENHRKNITDAIDLLHSLPTGINVNIRFRRIDDFEFTPPLAIFDILDIPLYHGWLVDPQDAYTANAIGSKSYNALVEELVALETSNIVEQKNYPEEDCIDFAAAMTAALGVPSPCLSRAKSFDDSPHSVSCHHKGRKGDLEEETKLLNALKLLTFKGQSPTSMNESLSSSANVNTFEGSDENTQLRSSGLGIVADSLEGYTCNEYHQPEQSTLQNCNVSSSGNDDGIPSETFLEQNLNSCPKVAAGDNSDKSSCKESGKDELSPYVRNTNSDLSDGKHHIEPMYEGEEGMGHTYEAREPMYEGEMLLAEQVERATGDAHTPQQGDLIRGFIINNASQLTVHGLLCLQNDVKEDELCIFFRNNHFSTMFKFKGELYLLVTDQGYIDQPNLVWEKLNDVNGDTVFMTGSFEEFKLESHDNAPWNEQNAMESIDDYLDSIDYSTLADTTLT